VTAKSNAYERKLLELIFQAQAYDNLAENDSTSPSTALWFSLHTASPGEDGEQGTNEVSYGGYARVGVDRTTSGFSVSTSPSGSTAGASVSPSTNVTFPQCTSGGTTASHFAVGLTSGDSTGEILYHGALNASLAISSGVTPRLTTATVIRET
jgi:hypothetical protein